jgi:hypothetical protein
MRVPNRLAGLPGDRIKGFGGLDRAEHRLEWVS